MEQVQGVGKEVRAKALTSECWILFAIETTRYNRIANHLTDQSKTRSVVELQIRQRRRPTVPSNPAMKNLGKVPQPLLRVKKLAVQPPVNRMHPPPQQESVPPQGIEAEIKAKKPEKKVRG